MSTLWFEPLPVPIRKFRRVQEMRDKSVTDHGHGCESEHRTESEHQFRFQRAESELRERVREIVGAESVAAFARRCGFSETLVRKYLRGSLPSSANLTKMATVAGVTVDWLATGQGVRTRAELLALQRKPSAGGLLPPDHPHARRWAKLIELVEQIDDAERRDEMIAELFARAQEVSELAALRRAVAEIRAATKTA